MEHVDPVCGMTIEEEESVGTVDHDGVRYYFCAQSCLERFERSPSEFLNPRAAPAPCIPRSCRSDLERVLSAGWRSSRASSRSTTARTPSWLTCRAGSGSPR